MREASFLSQNQEKWRRVESILDKQNDLEPEESADLFVDLTDDLSFAQTHYPKSVTTKYLNSIVGGIYQKISSSRKDKLNKIVNFWRFEVPLATQRHHRELLFVFGFFILSVLIGVVSTHFDETFPRVVLGDEYVDMTLDNIEKGDPMGVYKDAESNSMFLYITLNNLRVAMYTFVAGLLLSIGTYYFLFVNCVMLGTFQYFFIKKGLFLESFLTIWIHGTIEISCIVIAGAAGIILGNSFLFPGSLPRKVSFIKGAKEAVKIFIGIAPLIVAAGFLESFVTRFTDAPNLLRAFIIFGSLAFIIWYFIIYPIRLIKKN